MLLIIISIFSEEESPIVIVYGISLTAIKFFADDKISRLTSGRPSQNFDIVGMSFPRRFEVKLDTKYTRDEGLRGQGYVWSVYSDPGFEHELGEEFRFQNNIDPTGWITYVTKGIFPQERVYLKFQVFEQTTELPIHTWYFSFTKDYQRSLDDRNYVKDPVSEQRVVKDGYLVEVKPYTVEQKQADGTVKTVHKVKRQNSILKRQRVSLLENSADPDNRAGVKQEYKALLFEQIQVHYGEEPTMAFFITPPHLMSYARIVLILINQMFNMQVDKSYLTNADQQPFYKTKYMLDEVGNLQSDGSGIPFLQTKESIGLGQGQRFTLILQTLQQLKDVYGDSIDKILQGNTGNIVYLKSTDDSMLEILQNLSGQMHRLEKDSQTISNDMYKVFNRTDGKLSTNKTVKEVPVISKNDMLKVPKGNLMVFGKGNPIWSRNQLAMPYSFMLLGSNPLKDFDDPKEYTLRTIPTTANTMDFDILNNQPDFIKMVSKRVTQARMTEKKILLYKQNHRINGHMLGDDDLSHLDPEAFSQEIMRAINEQIDFNDNAQAGNSAPPITDDSVQTPAELAQDMNDAAQENTEVYTAQAQQDAKADKIQEKLYAKGRISKHDLLYDVKDDTKECLSEAYLRLLPEFKASPDFEVDANNDLIVGGSVMIHFANDLTTAAKSDFDEDDDEDAADDAAAGEGLDSVLAGGSDTGNTALDNTDLSARAEVKDEWLKYLASRDSWQSILDGEYDKVVATAWDNK